jgi:hypothetical protein
MVYTVSKVICIEVVMNVFSVLAVIFLMAFLVESMVEYLFGTPFDKIPALQPYKWLLMYVAAIVGVAGAFIYRIDILYLLGGFVGAAFDVTFFGMVMTGLSIGRGANYLHDIVDKFFVKPETK